MPDPVADLLAFIDRSPTPYHAVVETERRLLAGGFERVSEQDLWSLGPGSRCFLIRNQGSLAAFEVGSLPPVQGGFRILGAHTDSPNLRLKPRADLAAHGYQLLAVEPYGGALLHTWLDRDLSLAGRVTVRGERGIETLLLDFARPLLRVPNLAIHLQREISEKGLKLDPQKHMAPVMGLEGSPDASNLIAAELRAQGLSAATREEILAFDLMAYDTQPSGTSGSRGEFIHAPRLDNLASCHAALTALADPPGGGRKPPPFTKLVVLYDHEEVGSRSAQGAASTLLADTLDRVVTGFEGDVDVKKIAKALKNELACGGTYKNGIIELQGDHRKKMKELLVTLGFDEDSISE